MSIFDTPPSDPRFTESVDLDALCARPSTTPTRDLTPPNLLSIAPPMEEPLGEVTRAHRILGFVQKTSRRQRLLAAAGGALVFLGLVTLLAASGNAEAKTALKAPIAALPIANALEAPPPPTAEIKLPPPPTTGAAGSPKAPPMRMGAAKPRVVAAPSGPKMTKIQSTGVR